jgi:TolB-like protein
VVAGTRLLDAAKIRAQLDRILFSAPFAHAERLRQMLRFLVEETLGDRGSALKEYTIGLAVCGRSASFDPKIDPIVRVDANRLRARLNAYYERHGAADEVLITIPKGSYLPEFMVRSQAPADVSLAVLPFVNMLGECEDAFFVDSLAESLIHSMSRLEGLRVIARSSVFQYQHRALDARAVARELGVTHVLEGSVRLLDGRLRVTTQFIDAAGDRLLWSEKFERPWRGVFALEDEIVASVTDALAGVLGREVPPAVFLHPTENPEAYAHYLRGRYQWNQRTPAALAESLRHYEAALADDPECTPAWAGIADTLMVMALNDQLPPGVARTRARAAAERALEQRPGWPEALVSRGSVRCGLEWAWEAGHRDFEEALRSQPGLAVAHCLCAVLSLQPRGLWSEARARMRSALQLDPVSPVLWRDFGLVEFMARDYARANECWNEAERLAPHFHGALFWRARMAIATGDLNRAAELLTRRASAGANNRVTATLGFTLARQGDIAAAQQIAQQLASSTQTPPLDSAIVHLGLRQFDYAFDYLEIACQSAATVSIRRGPALR